jgi:anti-sigma regulatory factor (Ser/Thr protein kinase)
MSTEILIMGGVGALPLLYRKMDLPGTIGALSDLQIVVEQFCHHAAAMNSAFSQDLQYAILTATMEIAENIVHHAYATPAPSNWLRIDVSLLVGWVEIVLCDGGGAFDPQLVEARDSSLLWRHPQRSGWGLFLAQEATDDLTYVRKDGVNVWTLMVRVRRT